MNRRDIVLVYQDIQKGTIYCTLCNTYKGNIHGRCPLYSPGVCVNERSPNHVRFDNTKHRILVSRGICNLDKSRYHCRDDCNLCVAVKRGFVVRKG